MGSSGKHDRNSDSVSGIIAQVLMTCIVVIMVSLIAAFLFSNSNPSGTSHIKPENWVDTKSDTIYIKHTGGEKIATGDLEIAVYINGQRYGYFPAEISANLGGKSAWELADVIEINASETWGRELRSSDDIELMLINRRTREVLQGIRVTPAQQNSHEFIIDIDGVYYYTINASAASGGSISPCGTIEVARGADRVFSIVPANNYKILEVLVDGSSVGPVSSYTFSGVSANHSIHATFTVAFDIEGGAVVPRENYSGEVTVLGAAITYGAGGYDMMVTSRVRIGDSLFDAWGDYLKAVDSNVNDNANPRAWNLPEAYPAGTKVTIMGCSWQYNDTGDPATNEGWKKNYEFDSLSNSSNVKVLKNGDVVPAIDGFADQASIAYFVRDYVENGTMDLEENEAIYLFELGTLDLGSDAADFQDLVVLVSLNSTDSPTGEGETGAINDSGGTKLIIRHLGGDPIDFRGGPDVLRLVLDDGTGEYVLNTSALGVLESGEEKALELIEYGTDMKLDMGPGDSFSLMLVDIEYGTVLWEQNIIVG